MVTAFVTRAGVEVQTQFAYMLLSKVATGKCTFEIVNHVDPAVQKAIGCDITNLAGDMSGTTVLVCIACAGTMLTRPQDFITGKCCTPADVDVGPSPYRTEKTGMETNKWRNMARASQGSICKSDKSNLQKHIIENLTRKAEKQGIEVLDYKKLINDNEAANILRAADWVAQLCPATYK